MSTPTSIINRFFALIIDFIITLMITFFFNRFIPFGWFFSVILRLVYDPIFLSSKAQATPGKYLMKIKITDLSGNRISFKTSLLRLLLSYCSAFFLILGYFFAFFNDRKQTFHDLFAGTLAVDQTEDLDQGLFHCWLDELKNIKTSFNR